MTAFLLDAGSGRLHDEYGGILANGKLSDQNALQCVLDAMGNMTSVEKRRAIRFASERPQSVRFLFRDASKLTDSSRSEWNKE
jgi:hypothetical protein